jgi:integrase
VAHHPTPVWDSGHCVWRVDLRAPWQLGRRTVDAPPPPAGLVEAIHAARDLLESLRARSALSDPQLSLPVHGPTVDVACAAYVAEREYRGTSGKWLRANRDLLCRELKGVPLASLVTPDGALRLLSWRDGVRGRGVGPLAMKDRLCVFALMWRWCAAPPRQWVYLMPVLPSYKTSEDEALRHPAVTWIDESTFRAVRAAIYDNRYARSSIAAELRAQGFLSAGAAAVRDYVERRKLYLSFAFYTGMRRLDLNGITDAYLSREFDCYFRHGHKTGIEVAAESICPPFASDIAAESRRLGRHWRTGELICGGPWFHATRVIAVAARKLGIQKFGLMTCRRSFVYHKALAGVSEPKLVNLMGHVDSKMVRAVYLTLQPRLQRDEAGAAWPKSLTSVPGTGDGRVLPFPLR